MTDVAAPVAPEAPVAPDAVASTPAEPKRGRKPANKTAYRGKDAAKLAEWPADFNSATHQPLTADDFLAEDVFWEHKATEYEARACDCRKKADLFRRFGSAEKRKSAENASKMLERLLALKKELEGSGINLSDVGVDLSKLVG